MTTPFICDGSGRRLIEADDYDGPDTLYIWDSPHALFGPKRPRNQKSRRNVRRARRRLIDRE